MVCFKTGLSKYLLSKLPASFCSPFHALHEHVYDLRAQHAQTSGSAPPLASRISAKTHPILSCFREAGEQPSYQPDVVVAPSPPSQFNLASIHIGRELPYN